MVLVHSHTFVEGSTYANAVHQLQANYQAGECPAQPTIEVAGTQVVRAFTIKENLEARLNDFNTVQNPDGSARSWADRVQLFTKYHDSCSGVGYQGGTTKFKIIPICAELITIARGFNNFFLTAPYASLPGIELDTGRGKYNQLLSKREVLDHGGWRAVAEDDISLLTGYCDAVWSILAVDNNGTEPENAMSFWVRSGVTTNELRVLCILSIDNNSSVNGSYYLSSDARLLQVTPRRVP